MTGEPDNRPNRIPWPPLIYLSAAIFGLVVDVNYPLPWVSGWVVLPLQVMGAILGIAALGVDLVTVQTLRDHNTTVLPHKSASHLVTSGPFKWSRNPIYVGNTLLVLAAGLFFGKLWLLLLAFVAAGVTQKLAIEREERHLHAKFGAAWEQYAARVRRWV